MQLPTGTSTKGIVYTVKLHSMVRKSSPKIRRPLAAAVKVPLKNLSRRVEEVGVRLRKSEMPNNKLASLPDRAEPPCVFFSARFIDCTSIPSRELRFFGV
jgi:hypothetical protein